MTGLHVYFVVMAAIFALFGVFGLVTWRAKDRAVVAVRLRYPSALVMAVRMPSHVRWFQQAVLVADRDGMRVVRGASLHPVWGFGWESIYELGTAQTGGSYRAPAVGWIEVVADDGLSRIAVGDVALTTVLLDDLESLRHGANA